MKGIFISYRRQDQFVTLLHGIQMIGRGGSAEPDVGANRVLRQPYAVTVKASQFKHASRVASGGRMSSSVSPMRRRLAAVSLRSLGVRRGALTGRVRSVVKRVVSLEGTKAAGRWPGKGKDAQ